MLTQETESRLLQRFERATKAPPLMMLYPPVPCGHPYTGKPDAATLWAGTANTGTLYVHVPFCHSRCIFCPFYAVVGKPGDFAEYVDLVLKEAELIAPVVRHIRFTSIYLGGGTPSVFPPMLIGRLIGGLRERFDVMGADVSLEAHPAHITRGRMQELCGAGVTRLSLGVQSFDPKVLKAAGRGETTDRVLPAVEAAMDAPLRDFNIDLMYGLPDQSVDSWMSDLARATKLGIPGLTLYGTVYLPQFQEHCEKGGYQVSGPAERFAMYEMAYHHLTSTGYPQPHFGANAFLRGALNPHRRNVELGLPMLGLGTWAYSSTGPFAYHNLYPSAEWARQISSGKLPIRQLVPVPESERARKYVVEALLLAYLNLGHFRARFGRELHEEFPHELAVLDREGLVKIEDGELRLTRRGGRHLREIRYLFASESVVDAIETGAAASL